MGPNHSWRGTDKYTTQSVEFIEIKGSGKGRDGERGRDGGERRRERERGKGLLASSEEGGIGSGRSLTLEGTFAPV